MLSHCLVFCCPGAAGARLLSGQSKPTNMDVDEEENMSESARLSVVTCLQFRFPLHVLPSDV